MQLYEDLYSKTNPLWIEKVLEDFDFFLLDHADCERKAGTMMMSFVAKYPNRKKIIPLIIETAIEEMVHFQEVYHFIQERNLQLRHSIPEDTYMTRLHKLCRNGRDERFLDRLLIVSVVETRGMERFKILAEKAPTPEYRAFYKKIGAEEAKHGNIFIQMALEYFPKEDVYERYHFWLKMEAEIAESSPITGALH